MVQTRRKSEKSEKLTQNFQLEGTAYAVEKKSYEPLPGLRHIIVQTRRKSEKSEKLTQLFQLEGTAYAVEKKSYELLPGPHSN